MESEAEQLGRQLMGFGKYKAWTLQQVLERDEGYFGWMLDPETRFGENSPKQQSMLIKVKSFLRGIGRKLPQDFPGIQAQGIKMAGSQIPISRPSPPRASTQNLWQSQPNFQNSYSEPVGQASEMAALRKQIQDLKKEHSRQLALKNEKIQKLDTENDFLNIRFQELERAYTVSQQELDRLKAAEFLNQMRVEEIEAALNRKRQEVNRERDLREEMAAMIDRERQQAKAKHDQHIQETNQKETQIMQHFKAQIEQQTKLRRQIENELLKERAFREQKQKDLQSESEASFQRQKELQMERGLREEKQKELFKQRQLREGKEKELQEASKEIKMYKAWQDIVKKKCLENAQKKAQQTRQMRNQLIDDILCPTTKMYRTQRLKTSHN